MGCHRDTRKNGAECSAFPDIHGGPKMGNRTTRRTERSESAGAEKAARAIHHCLKYISEDAQKWGMDRTAQVLDQAANLVVNEARALATSRRSGLARTLSAVARQAEAQRAE